MGGFIKGIVVGAISFALGFAVLSVVIPEDPVDFSAVAPVAPPVAPSAQENTSALSPQTTGPEEIAPEVTGADARLPETVPETVPTPGVDVPGASAREMSVSETTVSETTGSETTGRETTGSEMSAFERSDAQTPDLPSQVTPGLEQVTGQTQFQAQPQAPETVASAGDSAAPDARAESRAPAENAEADNPAAPMAAQAAQDRAAEPGSALAAPDATPASASDPAAPGGLGLAGAEVAQTQPQIQAQPQTQLSGQIPDPAEDPMPAPAPAPDPGPGPQAPRGLQGPPPPGNAAEAQDPTIEETGVPAEQSAARLTPLLPPRVQTLPSAAPGISIRRGTDRDADASVVAGSPGPAAQASQRQMPGAAVQRLPSIGAPDAPGTIGVQGTDQEAELAGEPRSEPGGELAGEPEPANGIDDSAAGAGGRPAGPAYRRNAAITDPQPGLRPMAVILTESATSRDAILDLMMPVTVAVNPLEPGAALRAQAYRQAGHEIALLAVDVPVLSTASDLAVTLQSWLRDFPQALAIMDVRRDGLASSRTLARDMVQMMEPEGLAAIARRSGLDSFRQSAEGAGLPSVSIYRALGDTLQNAATLRRMIDRAAFEALRQDSIVITGSADNPEIVAALNSFAMGGGRDGVMLAPVSVFFPTE